MTEENLIKDPNKFVSAVITLICLVVAGILILVNLLKFSL